MSAKPRKHERLLTQMIDALPKCEAGDCQRPATKKCQPRWEGDPAPLYCDSHAQWPYNDLPYADALREATS